MELETLGWDAWFEARFEPFRAQGLEPARVVLEHQHVYRVSGTGGEPLAHVSGRFRHAAAARAEYPAVGDWVAIGRAPDSHRVLIQGVLPRRSRFSRKVAGSTTEEQVVAANIDTVFIVTAMDRDFNLRRLERYLITASEGGAAPVIILNKSDLVTDVSDAVAEIARIAPGVPVHPVSGRRGSGLEQLAPYLIRGRTVALLGSSGVGKSTIINRVLGREKQRTREVRATDSRGRHTTSHRELIVLPAGGLLIDTPGMRELQLWESTAVLESTFEDVARFAPGCHFRDCRHDTEPRCGVRAAVEAGQLPAERLDSFLRLQRELEQLTRKQDERIEAEHRRKLRPVHKAMRSFKLRE